MTMSLSLKQRAIRTIKQVVKKRAPIVVVASGLLLAVAVLSPTILIAFKEKEPVMLAYVDAASMFSEFVCSCCGKNIGECDCGMAEERRTYVKSLADSGLNKDRKSTRLNSSHIPLSRMPSSA